MGEFDLIGWIRERSESGKGVETGIGDDCAVLRIRPGAETLVTTDMLMEGRHFRLDEAGASAVGYKALAVNLSDIAAMAGVPIAAFVAVALPKREATSIAMGLHEGIASLARAFGVTLAGGDTNAWDGPLVVSVTVLGESTDRKVVRRSGAQVGDAILVTGPLGGSLLGRHLHPLPRVTEALAIARSVDIRSMIDLSDGLSSDLGHILKESGGLGATLDGPAIPIHDDARRCSTLDGLDPLQHALNDGEDFELCLTLRPEEATLILANPPGGVRLFRVGTIDAQPGLRLRGMDGIVRSIQSSGFDHLASLED
ncbi:thiamine-phosphate kinase [Tundrisphaera lichenicola]|uniref:thiamine-phosphate kinase n=1 Tax=Tundrisphaera lichenicola TaxID=2029860 RepID=UPI003EBE6DD4